MKEAYKPLPAAEDLWELFSYNPLTGQLHWRVSRSGTSKGAAAGSTHRLTGHKQAEIDGEGYQLHRLVWKWAKTDDPSGFVDHRNADPSDNRIWNLREATSNQNQHNRKLNKNSTTGFKGVHFHKKRQCYQAHISYEGKKRWLGYFDTAEEAHQAYCKAAADLHGDFARLR